MRRIISVIAVLAFGCLSSLAGATSEQCIQCHLKEEGGPVHAMLQSGHGSVAEACEACHGPSAGHLGRPTELSPDVSYGPRWTANSAEQDGQCLNCHQANVAAHWNQALHMANNVTCVSCHDLHVEQDKILAKGGQMEVCTTCHKTQKSGIHGKQKMVRMNPECTQCHNPHADQRPQGVMLANDSQGCRRCHNIDSMAKSDKVSDRAKTYHKIMDSKDSICIDCHKGVAHGDETESEAFLPQPLPSREITLFYPGQSDADWLLSNHPGSQPLRQGSNCRQCHRGEEASMGASLGKEEPTSRALTLSTAVDGKSLLTRLSWAGTAEDTDVALMWGFGDDDAFRRGGCWAACHSDMPGMTRDRGADTGKYLWASREQLKQIGQQPVIKSEAALEKQILAGDFVELWQITLADGGSIQVGTLLADIQWLPETKLTATAGYADGKWTVEVRRPLQPASPLLALAPGHRYTFGVALHDKQRQGARHWVSLPMTLSRDGDDTDFIAH